MRPAPKADTLVEQLGLWMNQIPIPAVEAMFGMGIARAVMAAQKLGVFRELARAILTETELAERCRIDAAGCRHLMRCLETLGHVSKSDGRYRLSNRAGRWLDPESPTYIGTFIEFNYDQWEWWSRLEESLKGSAARQIHEHSPDDPYWRRYITAMYEIARLSAPEVARRMRLPAGAARILDVAGGHGWFAAELCLRYPGATATVMDLPGSARIGREIIAAAKLSHRVIHTEGNVLIDELGGPYDTALLFGIIHHLSAAQNARLIEKIASTLKPGGQLAVLDLFEPESNSHPDTSAFLGLHFHLTSASGTYRLKELESWMAGAGFVGMKAFHLKTNPLQTLVQARRPSTDANRL